MNPQIDNPGVAIKPPILYFISIMLGLILQWLIPITIPFGILGTLVGLVLVLVGVSLAFWGSHEFTQQGTNVNPDLPATAVITTGPYQFTRNPMYVGLTIAQIGIGFALNAGWLLIALIPTLIIMRQLVIAREERYLEAKFGAEYTAYKATVRRWL